jgi:LPPG:FO 2-phospho-L-lactate transferase
MKVVALAGGVGGAKLVDGLAQCLPHHDLSVIVNTGDDFNHFGLHISPDLDTICYTLAGIASPEHGWGIKNETWNVLNRLRDLRAPDWFSLGDQDLATHLERTRLLLEGSKLSEVTTSICRNLGIDIPIYPMTNDTVETIVKTKGKGNLSFQEYFVKFCCKPKVKGFNFKGSKKAKPVESAIKKINECDLVVICPSNPWVSIAPILSIHRIAEAIKHKLVLCVSPIVGGKALKGPAAKMFKEMGFTPSVIAVANFYRNKINAMVIDLQDADQKSEIMQCGIIPFVTDIVMTDRKQRKQVAREVISAGTKLLKRI